MTPAEKLAQKLGNTKPKLAVVNRNTPWKQCKLFTIRKSLGLTIRKVSTEIGISISGLSIIESGTDTTLTTAKKLAAFYGKTIEEIWPGEASTEGER